MQPVRLGAQVWCSVSGIVMAMLIQAPASRAQSDLDTTQQVNDRIRALSGTLHMVQHDYVIGNGDVLAIEVFDVQELSREVRVSQTGSIGIPLVPVRLHVTGLTETQAEQKIAEVLEANGLVTHPQVSVSVKERRSKPITVIGAVAHPMVYQADRGVTILEVLAEAGGVANDAGDTVIVTRASQEPEPASAPDSAEPPPIGIEDPAAAGTSKETSQSGTGVSSTSDTAPASSALPPQQIAPSATAVGTNSSSTPPAVGEPPRLSNIITLNLNDLMETGDSTNNILLQAGDVVTVPHAGIVYVLGAVGKPGGFVLINDRAKMTTLKVLALAGGLNRTAKKDHAVIIRKDNSGQQHEVAVDLKKVLERKAEDLQLLPSDILYVPDSASKQALLRAAELGVALGSGVALYRLAYH
jgi:polysaccharide export outer membrane protein